MSTWFAITLVAMFIVAFVVLAYWRQWHWTGLPASPATSTGAEDRPSKTLWDWLQLLGIPVALASLAFLLNNAESVRDQRHAEDAERENTLRTYLAQMSNLVLDRKLLRSKPGADVRNVARTATLTAVRRLDGPRRGLVVQFLAEARLLRREKDEDARALVASADFADAHLAGANLSGANLRGANLTDAKLRRAFLGDAELDGANLHGADLRGAALGDAELGGANLRGANLRGAVLGDADLSAANLRGAVLTKANFRRAILSADLRGANLTEAFLGEAELGGANLRGAILRDADLGGATLSGADLRDADLGGANLSMADLTDANLAGAILRDADLDCAIVAGARGVDRTGSRGRPRMRSCE